MKRYDTYKDSNVDWIGNIPSHWKIIPFRFIITQLLTGLNPRDNFKLTSDDNLFYVTIKNFKDGILYLDDNCDRINQQAWDIIQNRSDLQVGDILFASISRNGQAYIIKETPSNWNINESVFKIRPDFKKTISTYLYYSITNDGFFNEMFRESTGSTFKSIKQNKLKAMQLPLPPLKEQKSIVNYLEVKCGEIDKVIAMLQQRIELLQELRQSIITCAVTRGINCEVPLKNSGVEWIGMVPEHWKIKRIKHVAITNSGSTPKNIKGKASDEASIVWVRTTDLDEKTIYDSSEYLTEDEYRSASCPWLPIGTILVAMYGGAGTIGKSGILGVEATINQALCSLNTVKGGEQFLFYCIRAMRKYWMKFAASSRKDPNISQEIIRNAHVPVPPLSEQRDIVAYIETETAKLDKQVAKANRQISLLQELKQSIITEVVTGKRKVC